MQHSIPCYMSRSPCQFNGDHKINPDAAFHSLLHVKSHKLAPHLCFMFSSVPHAASWVSPGVRSYKHIQPRTRLNTHQQLEETYCACLNTFHDCLSDQNPKHPDIAKLKHSSIVYRGHLNPSSKYSKRWCKRSRISSNPNNARLSHLHQEDPPVADFSIPL
jgi:hypothetical protein